MAKEFPGRWEKLAAANQRCERRAAENLPNMEIYFGKSTIFFAEGGGFDQGNNDVNNISERVEQDEDTD